MASEERKDEDLLARNMEQLDLRDPDEAQADPNDNNVNNEAKHEVAITEAKPTIVNDWMSPVELYVNAFKAVVTHIDDDGIMYLYDPMLDKQRRLIRTKLNLMLYKRYRGPDPKALRRKYIVGEPCVVVETRYKPYRGRIIHVNEESATCVVHYIDYGFVKSCSYENIRKYAPLRHIPPQSHKCELNRIRPKGKKWDKGTLDFLSRALLNVNDKCFVRVVGEEINGIRPIELRYGSLWVNDYLVDINKAQYKTGWILEKNEEVIIQQDVSSKAKNDNSTRTTYRKCQVPVYPKPRDKEV